VGFTKDALLPEWKRSLATNQAVEYEPMMMTAMAPYASVLDEEGEEAVNYAVAKMAQDCGGTTTTAAVDRTGDEGVAGKNTMDGVPLKQEDPVEEGSKMEEDGGDAFFHASL
jgi:hypothetical protein